MTRLPASPPSSRTPRAQLIFLPGHSRSSPVLPNPRVLARLSFPGQLCLRVPVTQVTYAPSRHYRSRSRVPGHRRHVTVINMSPGVYGRATRSKLSQGEMVTSSHCPRAGLPVPLPQVRSPRTRGSHHQAPHQHTHSSSRLVVRRTTTLSPSCCVSCRPCHTASIWTRLASSLLLPRKKPDAPLVPAVSRATAGGKRSPVPLQHCIRSFVFSFNVPHTEKI